MAIQKNTKNLLKKLGLPYTCVINSTMDLIKDPASLGIYIYLQSKAENWVIREKDIMNRFGKGRDFVRSRLKDLRDVGLLVSKSTRSESGKIVGWTTYLYSHIESQIKNKEDFQEVDSNLDSEAESEQEIEPEPEIKPEPPRPKPQKMEKTTTLVNPTHIKERDLSLVKKETTTTDEVVISQEMDKELIELRNEYMPNDERVPEEFIKQCKWHLDKGDKNKYNFSQRVAGLKTLIRKKTFEMPAKYPVTKKNNGVSDIVLYNQYANGIKSDISLRLLPTGTRPLSFEEWKKQG